MKNRLITIFYILIFDIALINTNNSLDFRFVSYNGMFRNIFVEWFFKENSNILESLENIQVYDNGDEAFDAITIDQQNNQIIIGAK
jgi:hypothetical protein